jgi:hypothetical protein
MLLLSGLTACLESSAAVAWQDDDASPVPAVGALALGDSAQGDFAQGDLAQGDPARPVEAAREAALTQLLEAMPGSRDAFAATEPLPALETVPAPNLALGDGAMPLDSMRCVRSLRARTTSRGEVAVWWSQRAGGRVHLIAAWRDANQQSWRGPIVVDSLDVGSTDARDVAEGGAVGCDRPAPGLAVDGANGYVHVSYALVGPEGPGIFYAHQMDPRAAFEPPVPIVYGERLGAARVSSAGDLVAVAYEDPNSGSRLRIALAVSRTAGHIFERRLNVSAGLSPAANPFVVAQGAALVVGWDETPPGGGAITFLHRRALLR